MASEVVDRPEDADVIFNDGLLTIPESAKQIRSCDYEKVLALMN